MIARCPNCLYGYEVESHGKYRCGVCGKKFFLFRNGAIESADDVSVETQKTSSDTDGRRFHTGSVILGHYRVIGLADVADSRVIYRCFDEKIAEHVFLQDLFPDVAIADEKTAVRFQVIAESEIQTESSAASAPAVAPVLLSPRLAPGSRFRCAVSQNRIAYGTAPAEYRQRS